MKTTLNQIRDISPCASGWKKLLTHLGKTKADDEALSIITILESNGLDDALWCLRAVTGHDREIRLYAAWCARQVQHLMTDKRSIDALDVAEHFAIGLATDKELAAARDAAASAWDAAGSAAMAARDAAGSAARAAWDAAGAAQEKRLRKVCAESDAALAQPVIAPKWVGLTEEEIKDIVWHLPYEPSQKHIRDIEAKLKEKNT